MDPITGIQPENTDDSNAASSTVNVDDSNPNPDTPSSVDDDKSRRKPGAEKRINQLHGEKMYWKGIAESLMTQNTPAPKEEVSTLQTTKAPNRDDFDDPMVYADAVVSYRMEEAEAKKQAEADKRAAEKSVAAFKSSVEKARVKYEDFDVVAGNPSLPFSQTMMDAAGENAAEVLYILGNNIQEAARIHGLPPVQQIKEIGKLESQIIKPKKETGAPNPVTTIKGGSASPAPTPDDKLPRRELHAKWEKQRLERLKKNYG